MVKNIDEHIEDILKDESAQTQAVKSLIEVKPHKVGEIGSDIELKTDLDERQICVHTAADMLQNFLDVKTFKDMNLISDLVQIKERKLLSKNRKSRGEIVDVAKTPDMTMMSPSMEGGFVKRLFTSRKNRQV